MLTQELARGLIPLVNSLDTMDLLKEYIEFRKGIIVKNLIFSASSIEEVAALQGAYKELDILSNLKSTVDIDKL